MTSWFYFAIYPVLHVCAACFSTFMSFGKYERVLVITSFFPYSLVPILITFKMIVNMFGLKNIPNTSCDLNLRH